MIKRNLLVREIQREVVAPFAQPVDVGHAFREVDLRNARAGIAEAQSAELNGSVGRQVHRTAVFKFDLRTAAVAGAKLGALRDRQVDKSILESQASVLVDLNRSLNIAQAYDTRLRTCESGQRDQN